MRVCKRRFLLDCVPKLIRHMRIFHTFSSCISALLPTLCNSLEVKLLKDKKRGKNKEVWPRAKECSLIRSLGKKRGERLQGEKKQDKKNTEGEKSRAAEWRRKCQKASLGGKFRGGQDGETRTEGGEGRLKYGCAEGNRNE